MTRRGWLWLLTFALLSLGLAGGSYAASAQAPSTGDWSVPVNLSRSGAASDPVLVATNDGRFHALWIDTFAGTMYTGGDGATWSVPAAVSLPFGANIPELVAAPDGGIYAFWIDPNGRLFASKLTRPEDFASAGAWTRAVRLGNQAISLDAAFDSAGRLHVAYFQTEDFPNAPAGIYYTQIDSGRSVWLNPTPLYQSPYVRSLTAETAHITIGASGAAEAPKVFVVWDIPSRERVYFARSLDGGATWAESLEVDKPIDGTITGGPANITLGVRGDQLVLLWQTDRSGANCSQYYQLSPDGGETWLQRSRMLAAVPGCPQNNELLTAPDNSLLLVTTIQNQTYLLDWNGSDWSDPQLQAPLASFVDPETFKSVALGCRTARRLGDNLYVSGCDQAGGQDIWILARPLTDVSTWFSAQQVWSLPAVVSASPTHILQPVLLAGPDSQIHAFWSQPDTTAPTGVGTRLYYARLEGSQWSLPQAILRSPDGISAQPAAAIDAAERIFLVWSGGQSGEVYFSSANAVQAAVPSAWSEPLALPSPARLGSAPVIKIDAQGTLWVAYAVPLNEARGIYLVRSDDGGATWSEPQQVFNAAAAAWTMVDSPRLAVSASGVLHLLWTRASLPSGIGPQALAYASSGDGGLTWTPPQTVVEAAVLWSEIVVHGSQVHRLWQELSGERTTLWHEESLDGGGNWRRVAPVSIFGTTVGHPALSVDPAGRLQLLQAVDRGLNSEARQSYALQHWMYADQVWSSEQSMDLGDVLASGMDNVSAAAAPDGHLGVVFSGDTLDALTGATEEQFFFVSRRLQLPQTISGEVVGQAPIAATLAPARTVTPAPSPTPDAKAILAALPQTGRPGFSWLGAIIGLVLAGIVVLGVVIYALSGLGRLRREE